MRSAPLPAHLAVLLLSLLPSTRSSAAEHAEVPASARLSVRAHGLVRHLFDVSAEARYYPLRLDEDAAWTVNPGMAIAWDHPLPLKWIPQLRVSVAGYSDCAAQPAGYLGVFPLFPELRTRHFTFAGGIGLGMAVRRSWKRHVDPAHVSNTFWDWGPIEGVVGPFGELDFRLHPEDRRWELVTSIIPGVPYLLVASVGLRVPVRW